jgi:hypothetical protein
MRPTLNTYRDQEHIYTFKKTLTYCTHISTHHRTAVPNLPSHVIPCIQSFYNTYPKDFLRASSSFSNENSHPQAVDYTLPNEIFIYTDASVQNQISAIACVVTDKKGEVIN